MSRGETVGVDDKTLPLLERCLCPLVFEPGTSWEYGMGIDLVGIMISRVNKESLQSFMEKNIWDPLNIKDMTFHIDERSDMRERKMPLTKRESGSHPQLLIAKDPDGKVVLTDEKYFAGPVADEWGGVGAFATAPNYLKILKSICSDDGKLLKSTTVDEMFKPQLGKESQQTLQRLLAIKEINQLFGGLPDATIVNFGLGSMLNMNELPSGRTKGSMMWSGYPNLIWWIDRERGCGYYATQILPAGDSKVQEMNNAFEAEMYKQFKA